MSEAATKSLFRPWDEASSGWLRTHLLGLDPDDLGLLLTVGLELPEPLLVLLQVVLGNDRRGQLHPTYPWICLIPRLFTVSWGCLPRLFILAWDVFPGFSSRLGTSPQAFHLGLGRLPRLFILAWDVFPGFSSRLGTSPQAFIETWDVSPGFSFFLP